MFDRLKTLFAHTTVYGLGDVATSLVGLLLLPIFTRYLTPAEYGVIALLLMAEAGTKVLFRWGVDTAFLRLYYDCVDTGERQALASSIFFFLPKGSFNLHPSASLLPSARATTRSPPASRRVAASEPTCFSYRDSASSARRGHRWLRMGCSRPQD